jgi:hypothetical protein
MANLAASPSPPALAPEERFKAYRRMLASERDEWVHWWYFGSVIVTVPGLPPFPAINAATLMAYRSETLSNDDFLIHWDEVGYFLDYVSAAPVDSWLNPVTGRRISSPCQFAEGPALYHVTRSDDGVAVTLTQPGATVDSIQVAWHGNAGELRLVQRERKTRGFPEVDGRLPDPESAAGFEAVTELAFLDRWPSDGTQTRGLYAFALAGAPPWMGFEASLKARATVHGVILKSSPRNPPRPEALATLQHLFPDFCERHSR